MIRSILFVDLPYIIRSFPKQGDGSGQSVFSFVCEPSEAFTQYAPFSILRVLLRLESARYTWICEDHWHLLGFLQARTHARIRAWDISWLAMKKCSPFDGEDILLSLLEYCVDQAAQHQVESIFARVGEDTCIEHFLRADFQKCTREQTFVLSTPSASDGVHVSEQIQRWQKQYLWNFTQLYRAVTPRKVQLAEMIDTSDTCGEEIIGPSWRIPRMFAQGTENYVYDLGIRLAGWVQIQRGGGNVPHRMLLLADPEYAYSADALVRFAIGRLNALDPSRPVSCTIRDYMPVAMNALRDQGFVEQGVRQVLVRTMTERVRESFLSLAQQQVTNRIKSLGTAANAQRIMKGDHLYAGE